MLTKKYISALVYGASTFYIAIWSTTVREELQYTREVWNAKDRCTTSVLQSLDVVRHLPQKISRLKTRGSWNIM